MPSCLQRGPSVAIPSVQTPKLSNQRLHPHFIIQVGQTLSEALHQGRQAETDKYEQVARIVVDNRNPQQKADDWLKNIANEDDETKDAIMQTLWKQEDFPST
jgi:hypothetical protein